MYLKLLMNKHFNQIINYKKNQMLVSSQRRFTSLYKNKYKYKFISRQFIGIIIIKS